MSGIVPPLFQVIELFPYKTNNERGQRWAAYFLPVLLPAIKQRSMPIRGWPGYSHGRVPPNIKGNMNWQMYQSQKAGLAMLGNISA